MTPSYETELQVVWRVNKVTVVVARWRKIRAADQRTREHSARFEGL